jgi:hypothetical protein
MMLFFRLMLRVAREYIWSLDPRITATSTHTISRSHARDAFLPTEGTQNLLSRVSPDRPFGISDICLLRFILYVVLVNYRTYPTYDSMRVCLSPRSPYCVCGTGILGCAPGPFPPLKEGLASSITIIEGQPPLRDIADTLVCCMLPLSSKSLGSSTFSPPIASV